MASAAPASDPQRPHSPGGPAIFRGVAVPARRYRGGGDRFDRQARSADHRRDPSAALIYKGIRIWRNRGPEFPPRVATWLVLGYFLFFPLDLWVLSRDLAEGAPNPPLYAALLAAIHLLLFATFVRLYSARTNRDYAFLAVLAVASMLASAILTVETGFLIALGVFLVLVCFDFRRARNSPQLPMEPFRRPCRADSPTAHQLNRASGHDLRCWSPSECW